MKSYKVRDEVPAGSLTENPELLRQLLFHRGLGDALLAEAFLKPDYVAHAHDPYLMKDMEKAVKRILHAVEKNERIVIYTDYDADGIPAGVIFHDFFKKIGFENFENYFPHRYEEGYGLNLAAVEKFAMPDVDDDSVVDSNRGKTSRIHPRASLLITADCGIADVEPVKRANELGMDVIITDHHEAQEELPPAYAILDPKQAGCAYPFKSLCGSGVVFKLVQALLRDETFDEYFKLDAITKERIEKWLLDMVGLATMADMVPLTGENRVFARYGLTVLRKSPRLGLMKLLRKIKVSQRDLTEDDIAFMIVPRINAASRMGLPIEAFQLLTATDDIEADRLSDHLNRINDERKGMASAITKEVKKHLNERMQPVESDAGGEKNSAGASRKRVLVIGNPKWRPPLLGPVANSIMESYDMPVFLWGRADGDAIKGSCRSDGSVSLVEIMQTAQAAAPGIFLAFGGHRASGGFSISHEKIHLLEDELAKAYEKMREKMLAEEVANADGAGENAGVNFIDKKMTLEDVTWDNFRLIDRLAPFGEGNPKPVFLFERVAPTELRQFGKEKNHLEMRFARADGSPVSAIAFFATPESFTVAPRKDERINLVATMEKSVFRNYPELRLRVIDVI